MKQKGLFKNLTGLSLALVLGLFMTSCGDDEANPPTIKISINSINGYTIEIGAEASSDVVSWHWEYGDGVTSDSIGGHSYTYSEGGDYTVKCTVINADGLTAEATKDVNIATLEEILMSHPWVLASSGNNGIGYKITPELKIDNGIADVLAAVNMLRAEDETYDFTEEYKDVYTFGDGTLDINTENGNALTSWVYGGIAIPDLIKGTCKTAGFFAVGTGDVQGATWKVHKNTTLKINTVTDINQDGAPDDINNDSTINVNDITPVTFDNVSFVSFEGEGYLGVKDFGVTDGAETSYQAIALIRTASIDKIEITLFIHMAVDGTTGIGMGQPCYFANLTLETGPTQN
jgi:PKD repeat protein